MNLEFFVRDKRITRKGFQPVVADTSGHYTFTVEFDREWDGLTKVVVFQNGAETAELIYTGKSWLPDNVSRRGDLYVACHGYRRLEDTTAVVRTVRMTRPVRILESGLQAGKEPERYTPTVFEQVMAAANAAGTAAREAKEARETLLADRAAGALDGKAATVTVGTVETGEAASVTNGGTPSEAVLNFVLPQGPKGEPGEAGVSPVVSLSRYSDSSGSGVRISVTSQDEDGFPVISMANVIDGKNGAAGAPGKNGSTYVPSVSEDGELSWEAVSGGVVTGVEPVNIKGPKGDDGKTAYQYAQDGGYAGTEEEYAAKLAEETYSKAEIDEIMGSYIADIDALIGGDA